MKMRRIASLQAQPLAPLPLGALKLAYHDITRRWAHTIEKQHTLQVVHFVLKGTCEQSFSLHFHCFSLTIHTAHDHMRGSWCRAVHPRKTEAPLVFLDPPFSFDNLRVDEGHQRVGLAATRHIDHEQAERDSYLRSSQANTRCVVHGLNHTIDQALESIVNGHNRLSLATQRRIGECVDWQHRHALCRSAPCRMLSRTIPRENPLMYSPFCAQAQCVRSGAPASTEPQATVPDIKEKSQDQYPH